MRCATNMILVLSEVHLLGDLRFCLVWKEVGSSDKDVEKLKIVELCAQAKNCFPSDMWWNFGLTP